MARMNLTVISCADGIPPEPHWAYRDAIERAAAANHWRTIVCAMRESGTLAVANGHAIRRLVEYRIIYDRAARHVAEHGTVVKSKRADSGVRSRWWTVMCEAEETIRLLEAELGIAPVRRSKAKKLEKLKTASRPADAYLEPRN